MGTAGRWWCGSGRGKGCKIAERIRRDLRSSPSPPPQPCSTTGCTGTWLWSAVGLPGPPGPFLHSSFPAAQLPACTDAHSCRTLPLVHVISFLCPAQPCPNCGGGTAGGVPLCGGPAEAHHQRDSCRPAGDSSDVDQAAGREQVSFKGRFGVGLRLGLGGQQLLLERLGRAAAWRYCLLCRDTL